ncbi:MAG: molybdate ABC transporter substrate-binding protein [Rhizobiaceae bacterium]|nr:molybdate ABC transporter substrate-binding protein [Rhizobiaceae bacterium]MCV0405629.1 molybdate ABC transporter substrate-binding protein [Rhizobiaceae bacterium]
MTRCVRRRPLLAAVALLFAAVPSWASADEALVAVAANFAEVAEGLFPIFKDKTGHDIIATIGSTGKLYAQTLEGAPFDAMLSADTATPERLVADGKAVDGSSFTYAVGRLALWSANPARIDGDGRAVLEDPELRYVAIANPSLAPYGAAARETLQALGLWETLQLKIAIGQNIGQTFSMVSTGAAEIGFVALSSVLSPRAGGQGSRWDVPQEFHEPIRQDAVLLEHGADNMAAKAFLNFLRSPEAVKVIESHGYAIWQGDEGRPD